MSELWEECLTCQINCCNHEIASQLFVTPKELNCIKSHHLDIAETFNNGHLPCSFLSVDQRCRIHSIKPVDCRLFPFDLIKDGEKFLWIIRLLECPITRYEEHFEGYLRDFEEKLIPDFEIYMEEYAQFRCNELAERYGYKILREVKYRMSLVT